MAIKVRATQLGYYDLKRKKEGEIFYVSKEEHFSKRWMQRLKDKAPESDLYEEPVATPAASKKGKRIEKNATQIADLDAMTDLAVQSSDEDVI